MRQAAIDLLDEPPLLELIYGSVEPISFSVEGLLAGQPVDPTGLSIDAAFISGDTSPVDDDFQAGSWDVDLTGRTAAYSGEVVASGVSPAVTYSMYGRVGTVVKFVGYVRWR